VKGYSFSSSSSFFCSSPLPSRAPAAWLVSRTAIRSRCCIMGGPRRSGFKQFTSEMVFGKTVTVHVTDRDGYGRTVADVILPDSRVLNRELGAAGLAWWYRQYSKDESLGKLEAEARATRRVLWADRDPSRPGAGGSGRRGGSAEG